MTWEQQRTGKFTASNIYRLLKSGKAKDTTFGETAKTYIKEVAAEIFTGEKETLTSRAMEWGLFHEAAAFNAYKRETGINITRYGTENPLFIEFSEYSGGSPDAVTGTHLVEVKCPYRSVNHLENMLLTADTFKDERPEYYAQIQFNMILTQRSRAHFVSFDPRMACQDQQLFMLEINEDKEYQQFIIDRIYKAETELQIIIKKILKK
jgi:hypothetical protein